MSKAAAQSRAVSGSELDGPVSYISGMQAPTTYTTAGFVETSEKEEAKSVETIELMERYKKEFELQLTAARSRQERCEMLLGRRHLHKRQRANERLAKLIRRHVAASQAAKASADLLDQVNYRLQQLRA